MESFKIQKEYDDEGETIYNHREYEITHEKNEYTLRIETDAQNLYFVISLKDRLEYNYKTNMNLNTIVDKLSLNPKRYSNLELILPLFDKIYENKNLLINFQNDEYCSLILKFNNNFEEETFEIKLYKLNTKMEDKINIILEQIKSLKKNQVEKETIKQMNKKINELTNNMNKKDQETKELINEKNNIIEEMNKTIKEQEKRIKDLENQNKELIGKKDMEELFNKYNNEIKDKFSMMETVFNDKITEIKEEMNNINNKMEEQEKNIKNCQNILDDILNNLDEMINIRIDNTLKNNNQLNLDMNKKNIKDNELNDSVLVNVGNIDYENKINHEFIQDPKKLKFKKDITITNTKNGWNDLFEIFISCKDNKEYLVSPNVNDCNLDIYLLINQQKIKTFPGHKKGIRTIRYFKNEKNNNEYLISADDDKKVLIWEITYDYNIIIKNIYMIDTQYLKHIYSCLLLFPDNIEDSYIVTSSYTESENNENSATKVYSLNNKNFVKYINNTNNIPIYYLLSWLNQNNHKYYIIQFSYKKIIINNLLEDELYSELSYEPEANHFGGFIFSKDKKDLLCTSSSIGFINIWDLYDKKLINAINTNECQLANIIKWNERYFIASDRKNKSIKIIDTENKNIHDIKTNHSDELICVKKMNHPTLGESLLSASRDSKIKLWIIK